MDVIIRTIESSKISSNLGKNTECDRGIHCGKKAAVKGRVGIRLSLEYGFLGKIRTIIALEYVFFGIRFLEYLLWNANLGWRVTDTNPRFPATL